MKTGRLLPLLCLGLAFCACPAPAQTNFVDIPLNTEKTLTTALGVTGLPSAMGSAQDCMAVLRLSPLAPGGKYEATMTFDAGTDIGYGLSFVDGNPFGQDWFSFVGLGTGTGTREMPDKQRKFIFSIHGQSTSNALFIVLRTSKPFTFRFGISDKLSGATPQTQDKWGYTFVDDFDADKNSPFLLKRGGGEAPAQTLAARGPWLDIPLNTEKAATTTLGVTGLPSAMGSAQDCMAVMRLLPLAPGGKYEATMTFDAGTDIGYGLCFVDGDPFGKDWFSFVGLGTGTGTREMPDKQRKFIFSIHGQSTSNVLFIVLRTNKPFTFKFAISDKLSGATPQTWDKWGYTFVDDFDADKSSPFLLKR